MKLMMTTIFCIFCSKRNTHRRHLIWNYLVGKYESDIYENKATFMYILIICRLFFPSFCSITISLTLLLIFLSVRETVRNPYVEPKRWKLMDQSNQSPSCSSLVLKKSYQQHFSVYPTVWAYEQTKKFITPLSQKSCSRCSKATGISLFEYSIFMALITELQKSHLMLCLNSTTSMLCTNAYKCSTLCLYSTLGKYLGESYAKEGVDRVEMTLIESRTYACLQQNRHNKIGLYTQVLFLQEPLNLLVPELLAACHVA